MESKKMKAIIQHQYGGIDTLMIKDVKESKPLKPNQFKIQVKVGNITTGDKNINTIPFGFPMNLILRLVFGLKRPRNEVRGICGSGIVVEVGSQCHDVKVGDHINVIHSMKQSVFADYLVLNSNDIYAIVDPTIPFEQSAGIPFGAMTAYHFLNQNTIKPHQKVLIYGASGAVGTYALMLAKYYQAEVTAVMRTHHQDKIPNRFYNHIIDYTSVDLLTHTIQYDVVFDAVGKMDSKVKSHLLKKGSKFYSVKSPTKESKERLKELNQLLKGGKILTVIDQVYPFEAYKEAHNHVYDGHKTGNVLLTINT
jgi:NADPH:quinone reductase-like Zn-dependent oxidoreductase